MVAVELVVEEPPVFLGLDPLAAPAQHHGPLSNLLLRGLLVAHPGPPVLQRQLMGGGGTSVKRRDV